MLINQKQIIEKIVKDYNRFGGHCPECDDFLFTYALSYNPPKVYQRCLGCKFERDISDKVKESIGYDETQVNIYSPSCKEPVGCLIEDAGEQFDEMIDDTVDEYINGFMKYLDPPKETGKLDRNAFGKKVYNPPNSYWMIGMNSSKKDDIFICPSCEHLLSISDTVKRKNRQFLKCPFCKGEFTLGELCKL